MSGPWSAAGGADPPNALNPANDVADTGLPTSSLLPRHPPSSQPALTSQALPHQQLPLQQLSTTQFAQTPGNIIQQHPLKTRDAPPPPDSAPPPPVPQAPMTVQEATDSLSYMQSRRIMTELRAPEPAGYDFTYGDTDFHADEIDEWFQDFFWQWLRLSAAQRAFEWNWKHEYGAKGPWDASEPALRARVVRDAVEGLAAAEDTGQRVPVLGRLLYVVLGRWGETAIGAPIKPGNGRGSVATEGQLRAIDDGVKLLTEQGAFPVVWRVMAECFEVFFDSDAASVGADDMQQTQDELMNLMTIMYMAVQTAINDPKGMKSTRKTLLALEPSLPDLMVVIASRIRWDETNCLPQTQIFLLLWKSLLLVFGGTREIEEVKKATRETDEDAKDKNIITASPIDYHVFRQEITSKYPAYIPPQPALPLEAENTSLLPPIPNQPTRNTNNGILPGPSNAQGSGTSILHQTVHIATPAPSPPPSPAIGGKGGKKQNYQTNQNFPFMYPPLDATSNSAGGKGPAGVQGALVSRRWEGSDIPASILEAGELFSKRVRMTRATRQLWEEREAFLRHERGWHASEDDSDIDEFDLDNELTPSERELIVAVRRDSDDEGEGEPAKLDLDLGPHPERLSDEVKRRLTAVEEFYKSSLPHLQSLIIVLLKTILQNVTALLLPSAVAQHNQQQQQYQQYHQQHQQQSQQQAQQQQPQAQPQLPQQHSQPHNGRGNGSPAQRPPDAAPDGPETVVEGVEAARGREIASKAVTAVILLMLKWFKTSHVLKFEFMTQLLIDSNYIPLVLKLFAHQEVQQVVDSDTDRVDHSFFHFCNERWRTKESPAHSAGPELEESPAPEDVEEESEDDAAPPPIKLRRDPLPISRTSGPLGPEAGAGAAGSAESSASFPARPEVDELGCPVNAMPQEPITDFSRRNMFSLINYLRIMQKICKNKAHRNLLLVSYKSSIILRKSLKIPQPELRLYTFKLFKNQVPYCGRKWRQSNMSVITAIYLHCRPELRDEWLAGSDVDAEVEAALPLEQALRSLTHWSNLRRYPGPVGGAAAREAMKADQDFFRREVTKLVTEAGNAWDYGEDGNGGGSGSGSGNGGNGNGNGNGHNSGGNGGGNGEWPVWT